MADAIDKEPGASGASVPSAAKPPSSALSSVRRDLTDEELSSPGARKLLLDRLDQTEMQAFELRGFRDRYHDADKKVAVLTEQVKHERRFEILYGVALSVGSIFVGLAPSAWTAQPYGWLSLLIGVALIIGSILSKALK